MGLQHSGLNSGVTPYDFSKLSPEQQKEVSRQHMNQENDAPDINEELAEKAKKEMDKFRADHIV